MEERLQSFAFTKSTYEVPLLLTLFTSPLIIGTVHTYVIIAVCGMILISFLMFASTGHSRSFGYSRAIEAFYLILCLGCALMTVQIIPLPMGFLNVVSPMAGKISSVLESNLDVKAHWTISLDPPATILELLKAFACLMVFKISLESGRHTRYRILQVLAFSGFTVALIGFFQAASGEGKLFGFYSSEVLSGGRFISTFINANHLAGFLGFSACIAIGLGLDTNVRSKRLLFIFIAVCCASGVFLTLSRGGMAAFAASQVLMLFVLIRGRVPRLRTLAWWQLFVLLVLILVSWLAYNELLSRFETISSVEKLGSNIKFEMFRDSAKMAMAYWPAGVGRGAFESAIDMFKSDGLRSWSHAENEIIQVACDMGTPYALMFFGTFSALFIGLFLRPMSAASAGALSGVYMLGLQNFVDFSLEITSVAIAFFAVLGVISNGWTQARPFVGEQIRRRKWVDVAVAFSGIVVLIGSVYTSRHLLQNDSERVRNYVDQGVVRSKVSEVMGIIGVHRADYYLPLLVGYRLSGGDKPDRDLAQKMLLHSSFLNPAAAEPHLYLARLLLKSGLEVQAFSEYRQAIRLNPRLLEMVLGELDKWRPQSANLVRSVPEEPGPMSGLVFFLIGRQRYKEAVRAGEEAAAIYPEDFNVLAGLYVAYRSAKETDKALQTAERLIVEHPGRIESRLYRASVLSIIGRGNEALADLAKAKVMAPDDDRVLYEMANVHLQSREFEKARQDIKGVMIMPKIGNEGTAKAHSFLGLIAEYEGRFVEAVAEYQRARVLNPRDGQAAKGIVRAYLNLGERDRAIEVLEEMLRRSPGDVSSKADLETLKEARRLEMEKVRFKEYVGDRPAGD